MVRYDTKPLADSELGEAPANPGTRRVPEPLPAADDVPALASYWKRYYNTASGKGTEAEFFSAFRLAEKALK